MSYNMSSCHRVFTWAPSFRRQGRFLQAPRRELHAELGQALGERFGVGAPRVFKGTAQGERAEPHGHGGKMGCPCLSLLKLLLLLAVLVLLLFNYGVCWGPVFFFFFFSKGNPRDTSSPCWGSSKRQEERKVQHSGKETWKKSLK